MRPKARIAKDATAIIASTCGIEVSSSAIPAVDGSVGASVNLALAYQLRDLNTDRCIAEIISWRTLTTLRISGIDYAI